MGMPCSTLSGRLPKQGVNKGRADPDQLPELQHGSGSAVLLDSPLLLRQTVPWAPPVPVDLGRPPLADHAGPSSPAPSAGLERRLGASETQPALGFEPWFIVPEEHAR